MTARGDSAVARLGRRAWYGALWLAVVAGTLHITQLFSVGLSMDTLAGAGRGVLLLLIALGLAGNARLALMLAFLFSAHALTRLAGGIDTLPAVAWVELALLICSIAALFAGPIRLPQDEFAVSASVEPMSGEH